MIYGIGTDIVEVVRIEASITQLGDDFARRILTDPEFKSYEKSLTKSCFLSKRFAAKEAFSKALGTGLRAPATFQNITVSHNDLGKPILIFSAELQAFMQFKNIKQTHISISDEKNSAVAFVVLET